MILFQLSGEHPDLPADEIRALYKCGEVSLTSEVHENLLLAKQDVSADFLKGRLSMSHCFYTVDALLENLRNLNVLRSSLHKKTTFKVVVSGFDDNEKVKKSLGRRLNEKFGCIVDLKAPQVIVYAIKFSDKAVLSLSKHYVEKTGFAERDAQKRPFFHPTALKPKLARLMLNLAELKKGAKVLDPFCGSGSLLIEAALIGLDPHGLDMDERMVVGANKNLKFFNLKASVQKGDATKLTGEYDAIVTDLPYAKSSKVFGRDLTELYTSFLGSARNAIKKGGLLVMMLPSDIELEKAAKDIGYAIRNKYDIYVHKSLTRRLYVLKNG